MLFVVLVTDAGPRGADGPPGGTGPEPAGIAAIAMERAEAACAVLHLKTAAGAAGHAGA
ncbi:hypothetical protein [Mangrovicoccus sp. HB161399]|uniref:hypothetical protein n=1 Tax=Mangrovicoccus sp. HB161399 TaxID=2720392 RepID=UPI001557E919|nr:hypothetical protein [Mangrovicoccus sp. HB161399]